MSHRTRWILMLSMFIAAASPVQGSYVVGERQPKKSSASDAPALEIRHYARKDHKDLVTESANFRIVYDKNPEFMEKIARHAETVRLRVHNRWFGDTPYEWDGRATIYLFETHKQYLKQTGVTALAHARARSNGSFVSSRTVSLPCDLPDLFEDTLPHEVTHTVMANRFNGKMPRWADEGTAVLSETAASQAIWRARLVQARQKQELFHPEVLFTTEDESHTGSPEYYAQSMSLVQFFVAEKGRRTFMTFIMDSIEGSYKASLQKHYDIGSFDELHKRWAEHTFTRRPHLQDGPRMGPGLCAAKIGSAQE